MSGFFLTLEGGEGTGKSTQARALTDHFRKLGRNVVLTREPGGTSDGEGLRSLLVTGEPGRWSSTSEALLNYAARDVHIRKVIGPALLADAMVICDRFMDSTRVYQGVAGDCPMALIDSLEHNVVGLCRPNLTLIFDLDPAVGLARARGRGEGEDRYERKGLAYHEKLRDGFLACQARNPERCKLIDASQTEEQVAAVVLKVVEECLGG